MKFNYKYFIIFLSLFVSEALIAIYIHDDFIRPFVGDILLVILFYFAINSFLPITNKLLPLYIFTFAALVEIFQYFNIVQLLHLENNKLARIIIGTTFDIKDIFCYFIGSLILFLYQKYLYYKSP